MKRKRGGQKGNQNARTHGFYSGDLTPEQIGEFWHIIATEKLAPQFALMRIKVRLLLQQEPVNRRVLKDASRLWARLESGYSMPAGDTRDRAEEIYTYLEKQIPRLQEDLNK